MPFIPSRKTVERSDMSDSPHDWIEHYPVFVIISYTDAAGRKLATTQDPYYWTDESKARIALADRLEQFPYLVHFLAKFNFHYVVDQTKRL